MVDSISSKASDASLLNLIGTDKTDATQAPSSVSAAAAAQKAKEAQAAAESNDAANVTISPQARQAADAEKEVIKFSRVAQREQSPFDSDKVASFKAMVDNGRISGYLSGLNTDKLAASMLTSNKGFLVAK